MNGVNIGMILLQLSVLVFVATSALISADALEENYARVVVKRRDLSAQSKDDSGKMKKLYSNKEVVAFDDEDEQQQAHVFNESPSMVEQPQQPHLSRTQRTDRNRLTNSKLKVPSPVSDEFVDLLLAELSNTNARHKKPIVYPDLEYYEAAPSAYDAYDDIDQLIEDDMTLNELVKTLGFSGDNNQKQKQHVDNTETADMFLRNWNRKKTDDEATAKTVQVKENILLEDDYNNQLKSHQHQPSGAKNDKSDVFSTDATASLGPSPAMSANFEQPSNIKQQQAVVHEVDPNLSSKIDSLKQQNDYLFMFVVAGCILAGVVALVAAGVCWYTVHKNSKIMETEYGVKIGKFSSGTGSKSGSVKSTSSSSGDRRLAQSAQMYHYQHQKQQMIAMEKANNDTKPDNSDNSEGETEEGDYTVYECPGLAPTGEMEVKNPLFKEDFSQSLNNVAAATTAATTPATASSPPPPAYSTLDQQQESTTEQQPPSNNGDQLVQIDTSSTNNTVSISHVNELNKQ